MSTLRTAAQGATRYENNQSLLEAARRVGRNLARRSQRTTTAPRRLQNNQARNAEVAAAKAAARPKTMRPKTVRPNNGSLPRGKDKLIPRLKLLISQVTNDEDLQNFLISMYDETANDKYTVELFGGKTEEEAKQKISVHVELFSNKLYRGSTPQMSFNIKGDDMINLAYLMYLDMIHDTTIPKSMPFKTFCGETITVSVKVPAPTNKDKKKTKMENKIQESPVYILFGTGLRPKETDFIKTVQGLIDESGGKAEIAVKNNLPSIYPNILKKEMIIRQDQVTPNILTPGHNMFLSVDQEDEKATVTLDIQRTKYKLPNGTEAKIMYPLVSVANLMDPGKNMLIQSAKEDSKYFMLGLNNRDIRSRLTWNYKKPEFTINHDNGSTTIGAYYTDKALNLNSKNRKTKRGYAYIINNNKGDKYRFSSNVSKAKAKDGSTGEKVAKFLGDFLQALTVVSYIKGNPNNSKYHYCLATGDAMLANNFIFLCSRSGVSPNLWMATSTQQVSKVYGKMIDNIRTVKPAPTQVRNAPTVSNGKQVVSSGNNRTEGSGESSGTRSVGRLGGTRIRVVSENSRGVKRKTPNNNRALAGMPGRLGGTPIQIRNSNNNNKPPPVGGPNAQSGVGSRNSIVGNKNNNLNNSGNSQPTANKAKINERNNQRGVKRVRNNSVSQPPAKKVNTNRNKLLRNLNKKNLPNFVINGLMKSYDNKTKTANRIIRDANNFGKTIAAGIRNQRMGTLRKRP